MIKEMLLRFQVPFTVIQYDGVDFEHCHKSPWRHIVTTAFYEGATDFGDLISCCLSSAGLQYLIEREKKWLDFSAT